MRDPEQWPRWVVPRQGVRRGQGSLSGRIRWEAVCIRFCRQTAGLIASQSQTSNPLPKSIRRVWLAVRWYFQMGENIGPKQESSIGSLVGAEVTPWECELGRQLLPVVAAPMTSWLFLSPQAGHALPLCPPPPTPYQTDDHMSAGEKCSLPITHILTCSRPLPALSPKCPLLAMRSAWSSHALSLETWDFFFFFFEKLHKNK